MGIQAQQRVEDTSDACFVDQFWYVGRGGRTPIMRVPSGLTPAGHGRNSVRRCRVGGSTAAAVHMRLLLMMVRRSRTGGLHEYGGGRGPAHESNEPCIELSPG